MLLPVLTQAQSSYYEDDLYYNPKKVKIEVSVKNTKTSIEDKSAQNESVRVYDNSSKLKRYKTRDVDEYNRHVSQNSSEDIVDNDSMSEENKEGQPFEYAERIRRFHDPKFTTHITDDEYLDIYVEDGADVDIYYTNDNYVGWMSPFYYDNYYYPRFGYRWNGWYSNYGFYYDPWCYSSWGYYDPWYAGSFGWGWGGYYDYGYPGYGYDGGYYGYDGGGRYSGNRHSLNPDQRRFISSNILSGSTSRTTGSTITRSSSRSSSGVSAHSYSTGAYTRSSGTANRSSLTGTTTTRSSSSGTSRSSSSTSSSETPSSSSRSSSNSLTRSSSYTPDNSPSSRSSSYEPSRSSSLGSSSRSSDGGGSGSRGGRR